MGKIRTANERHKRHVIAASRHQPKAAAVPNVAAKPANRPPPVEAA